MDESTEQNADYKTKVKDLFDLEPLAASEAKGLVVRSWRNGEWVQGKVVGICKGTNPCVAAVYRVRPMPCMFRVFCF